MKIKKSWLKDGRNTDDSANRNSFLVGNGIEFGRKKKFMSETDMESEPEIF